ncbi:MAG: efflux RND transporter permease subunit, partial [Candidatus Acidiferrales bacterium]
MFVDFFIKRPIFATVCALIIILGGAVAIPTLPIAQFPNLAPPQVTVTSAYNGADAQTVESAVTIPLERSINGVQGLKYITSTSGNNGVSTITATFDVSRDPDLAAVDVQNRVQAAAGLLPAQVNANGVTISKGLSGFVFAAAFYSENSEYSSLFISNYVDVYVSDAIKRVPGVANVTIFGQRQYSMRLWLDPTRLAARGLTATDVISALNEQNVQVAAGQIGQPPAPTGQAFQISVRAMGQLTDPVQFDNIILKTGADGTLVRVKDVGHSELGAQDYSSNLVINGHEAIGLAVIQLPDANALQVDQLCKAELEKLAPTFPAGLKYDFAFDTTTAVSEGIRDVLTT